MNERKKEKKREFIVMFHLVSVEPSYSKRDIMTVNCYLCQSFHSILRDPFWAIDSRWGYFPTFVDIACWWWVHDSRSLYPILRQLSPV